MAGAVATVNAAIVAIAVAMAIVTAATAVAGATTTAHHVMRRRVTTHLRRARPENYENDGCSRLPGKR